MLINESTLRKIIRRELLREGWTSGQSQTAALEARESRQDIGTSFLNIIVKVPLTNESLKDSEEGRPAPSWSIPWLFDILNKNNINDVYLKILEILFSHASDLNVENYRDVVEKYSQPLLKWLKYALQFKAAGDPNAKFPWFRPLSSQTNTSQPVDTDKIMKKLGGSLNSQAPAPPPGPAPSAVPTTKRPSRNLIALQKALHVNPDGKWGPTSQSAWENWVETNKQMLTGDINMIKKNWRSAAADTGVSGVKLTSPLLPTFDGMYQLFQTVEINKQVALAGVRPNSTSSPSYTNDVVNLSQSPTQGVTFPPGYQSPGLTPEQQAANAASAQAAGQSKKRPRRWPRR